MQKCFHCSWTLWSWSGILNRRLIEKLLCKWQNVLRSRPYLSDIFLHLYPRTRPIHRNLMQAEMFILVSRKWMKVFKRADLRWIVSYVRDEKINHWRNIHSVSWNLKRRTDDDILNSDISCQHSERDEQKDNQRSALTCRRGSWCQHDCVNENLSKRRQKRYALNNHPSFNAPDCVTGWTWAG